MDRCIGFLYQQHPRVCAERRDNVRLVVTHRLTCLLNNPVPSSVGRWNATNSVDDIRGASDGHTAVIDNVCVTTWRRETINQRRCNFSSNIVCL